MKQPQYERTYSREERERELKKHSLENTPKKKVLNLKPLILVLIFLIVVAACILVFLIIDKNKVKKVPGNLVFEDSVTEEERNYISNRFELWKSSNKESENNIWHDMTFSAETVYEYANNTDNTALYDLYLPTVDFYSSELNVTESDAKNEQSTTLKWVSILELTPSNRVVSIDNNYWFDTQNKGAKYRVITAKSEDAEEAKLVKLFSSKFTADEEKETEKGKITTLNTYSSLETENYLSFAQTGVTALVRAMTNTLNGKAGGRGSYFADNIKDFLSTKDYTHISNEASFTDNCKGSTNTMMLCSDWRMLDTITAIGTDIVELTGNHNNNYGTDANIKTIDKYHELGMVTFGGGKNAEEAAKPLTLDKKGVNITLLGYNKSTSTVGNGELALSNTPGANGYDEERAKKDIQDAKARGDIVIVDIQFAECYSYPDGYVEMPACDAPINGQQSFFRHIIDLGADIVIGTQAHHPQTFELYKDKPIYYGLGNIFFDQTYWPGTQRGYVLTHYFDTKTKKYLNTRISPTWYDKDHKVYLTDEATSEKFIKRLIDSSPKGN